MRHDENVWLIEPNGKLYEWIKKLLPLLEALKTLVINNDIIPGKSLGEQRDSLLELAISDRRRKCYCL